MKLKILVKLVELILGETCSSDTPRADMYLPERLFAMCLVSFAGGTAFAIWAVITHTPWTIAAAVIGIGMGIASLLCWKIRPSMSFLTKSLPTPPCSVIPEPIGFPIFRVFAETKIP